MYDKGYYHSYYQQVLMPNCPTLIPKTTTPTPETLPPEGFVQALSGFDQLLKAVLEASYCWGLPS